MKQCRKEPTEPECLADLRATNPQADWERDLQSGARDGAGRRCYESVRSQLRRSQTCLCAYCEVRLKPGNEQIAHFHPKSDRDPNHNWALDWGNLWLACLGGTRYSDQRDSSDEIEYGLPENRSCDEATGNAILDGVILRPDEVPAFPRLFRYRQSPDRLDIEPDPDACGQAGIPIVRVETTIAKLNLNCRRLAEARLAAHRPWEKEKQRLMKSALDPMPALRDLAARRLAPGPDGCRRGFFTVGRWCLKQAAEDYLLESGFAC